MEVLGVPIGTDDFVQAKTLEVVTSWQNQLLRLRKLRGCRQVQYQMLRSCANTRPGFLLRCVFPRLMEEAAEAHDQMIQEAVGDICRLGPPSQWLERVSIQVSLPVSLGGLGVRPAWRVRQPHPSKKHSVCFVVGMSVGLFTLMTSFQIGISLHQLDHTWQERP